MKIEVFRLTAMSALFGFITTGCEQEIVNDDSLGGAIELSLLVDLPNDWKELDLPDGPETESMIGLSTQDEMAKLFVFTNPPSKEEQDVRNRAGGTIAGALSGGQYPVEFGVREIEGIQSFFMEGVVTANGYTTWIRNYYIPGMEAGYKVMVSRGQDEDWPDVDTILRIEDSESNFAKEALEDTIRTAVSDLKKMQTESRKKPGFVEPDMTSRKRKGDSRANKTE